MVFYYFLITKNKEKFKKSNCLFSVPEIKSAIIFQLPSGCRACIGCFEGTSKYNISQVLCPKEGEGCHQ